MKRARHAFSNLIIYRARPVVRRKLLSADGSYGDMPESMCTWSMLTRRSKHPLTAKRASLNGSPASSLHQTPRHTASSDASELPCPTLQIRGETSACSQSARLRQVLTSAKPVPFRTFFPKITRWLSLRGPSRRHTEPRIPNLGLVQDLHVLLVPAGAVETCFVGSTSRRHACVDAMTSTVLAVDRVPTAKISVSDNSIGSARARGEKGRRRRTPKQRLAITRRQARCKRSDDHS